MVKYGGNTFFGYFIRVFLFLYEVRNIFIVYFENEKKNKTNIGQSNVLYSKQKFEIIHCLIYRERDKGNTLKLKFI